MMLFEDTITLRKDQNGVYRVVEHWYSYSEPRFSVINPFVLPRTAI